jgi:sugar lactone lactonase YvrE
MIGAAVAAASGGGGGGRRNAISEARNVRLAAPVQQAADAERQRIQALGLNLEISFSGTITIEFELQDQEDDAALVALEFARPGEGFAVAIEASLADGGNPARLRGADDGVSYSAVWDTQEEPTLGGVRQRVIVRLVVRSDDGRVLDESAVPDPFTGEEVLLLDNTTAPEVELVDVETAPQDFQEASGPEFVDPDLAPERAGIVRVRFRVRDTGGGDVAVKLFLDGDALTPAAGGANPVLGLAGGGVAVEEFLWRSPSDVPLRRTGTLRLEVFDTKLGAPAELAGLAVNNTTPLLTPVTPAGSQVGRVPLKYFVSDAGAAAGDVFDVLSAEYSFTGSDGAFATATEAPGFPSSGTNALVPGNAAAAEFTYVWNSHFDVDALLVARPDLLPVTARAVLRLTVRDPSTGATAAGATSEFTLNQLLVATVAGGGVGDGDFAVASTLLRPTGMACDAAGSLYVADTQNHRVRRVDPAAAGAPGIVTFAGSGFAGFGGDLGGAARARLQQPSGVAVGDEGSVFIADTMNHAVRLVDRATAVIRTIAGTPGTSGFGGDGGPAVLAGLNLPTDAAFDAGGSLLIADSGNGRVRSVALNGTITTLAGGGAAPLLVGQRVTPTSVALAAPSALAVEADGDVFIAETGAHRVLRLFLDAGSLRLEVFAGSGVEGFSGDGNAATLAQLSRPSDVAADAAGTVYIADTGNGRVRSVDGAGTIRLVAGTAGPGLDPAGSPVPAGSVALSEPAGLAFGEMGDLFVAEAGPPLGGAGTSAGNRVLRLFADAGAFLAEAWAGNGARDESDASGDLTGRRRCTDSVDVVSAGKAAEIFGFSGDGGAATEAPLILPGGIALDGAGSLFVADTDHHRVRRVSAADGLIDTVLGPALPAGSPLVPAFLLRPAAIATGMNGGVRVLFVADSGNDRVLRAALDAAGGVADVRLVVAASSPFDVAYDSTRDVLYVAAGDRVFKVTAPGGAAAVTDVLAGVRPFSLGLDLDGSLLVAVDVAPLVDPNRINVQVRRFDSQAGGAQAGSCVVLLQGFSNFCGGVDLSRVDLPDLIAAGGLAVDPDGNLYISNNTTQPQVVRFAAADLALRAASVELRAVCADTSSANANQPVQFCGEGIFDCAFDPANPVPLPPLAPQLVAGTGERPEDGETPCETLLSRTRSLAIDAAGNLYLCETLQNRVRRFWLGGCPAQ